MKGGSFQSSDSIANLLAEMFELFTGHSGLNPDDIAESLDILKDQRVGPGVSFNTEGVQPFPLDRGVEGFDAVIVTGNPLWLKHSCSFFVGFRYARDTYWLPPSLCRISEMNKGFKERAAHNSICRRFLGKPDGSRAIRPCHPFYLPLVMYRGAGNAVHGRR